MEPGKGRSRQAPAHGCNTCCSRLWVPTEAYTCTFRATDLTSVIRNPLWFRWWKTRQRSTENKTINTHVLIAQNWQLLTFGMLQDFFKTKNNPISSISEFYTCLNSIYCSPLKRGMLSWIWYVSFQSLKQCVCIHTHTHTQYIVVLLCTLLIPHTLFCNLPCQPTLYFWGPSTLVYEET